MQAAFLILLLGGATAVQFRGEPKRKLLSVRLANLDYESDEDGEVTVNHLAKCGGSFVRKVLDRAIGDGSLHLEKEHDSLEEGDMGRFTIGLVRNPFDYYVSLWAFTSGRKKTKGGFMSALTKDQRKTLLGETHPFGESEDDKQRFHAFVKAVNSENLGVMSLRFHGSYLRNFGHASLPENWQRVTAMHEDVVSAQQDLVGDLEQFNVATGPVTCWVHTESIVGDLRGCLQEYEKEAGTGKVNWSEFDLATQDSKHNKADHAMCSTMYDEETAALVMKVDKEMFRAFNYPNQCSK